MPAAKPKTVAFELVPPATAFECMHPYDGTLIRVEAEGYETDDPRVVDELDKQQGLRRAKAGS